MSTRRTTRAASRASRDPSPAVSTADIPSTPRPRARRGQGNTPLPPVSLRPSNAYGTNTVPDPTRASGPVVADQITNVLTGLLEPVYQETASNVSAATKTPKKSKGRKKVSPSPIESARTYNNESGIFGMGGIESSVADPNDLRNIPEEPEEPANSRPVHKSAAERRAEENHQVLEDLARHRIDEEPQPTFAPTDGEFVTKLKGLSKTLSSAVQSAIRAFETSIWRKVVIIAFILFLVPLLSVLLNPDSYHWYGWEIKHNVGQFIPLNLKNPLSIFGSDDISLINQRLSSLEHDVKHMMEQSSSNKNALDQLQKLLPDHLIVKKDKRGNLLIPDELWTALLSKIRAEPTLFSDPDIENGEKASRKLAIANIRNFIHTEVKDNWEKYIQNNEVMKNFISEEKLTKIFPGYLKEHSIISKAEALDLIHKNWDEKKDIVRTDVIKLASELKGVTDRLTTLQRDTLTKAKLQAHLRNLLTNAQLRALAESNLKFSQDDRVNFFAPGAGATIDAPLTSDAFVFPSQKAWPLKRAIHWAINNPIPLPNAAKVALEKWDDLGECFCGQASPEKPVDLAVIMGRRIYPDRIIVEHISKNASLEPGSAPSDMELLAYVPEIEAFKNIKLVSDKIFPEVEGKLPDNYVRVAIWNYDINVDLVAQVFNVQLDMKSLEISTNELIVRSRDNWGNLEYTCLYRVKVFGEVDKSITS